MLSQTNDMHGIKITPVDALNPDELRKLERIAKASHNTKAS